MKVDIKGTEMEITEEEALDILLNLRDAFGWSGTEFTRADIESNLERALTNEEWEKVQTTWAWEKGLPGQACEAGWWAVDNAITEAELV